MREIDPSNGADSYSARHPGTLLQAPTEQQLAVPRVVFILLPLPAQICRGRVAVQVELQRSLQVRGMRLNPERKPWIKAHLVVGGCLDMRAHERGGWSVHWPASWRSCRR